MAEFSQALFDTICERIADGESLRAICREEGMITTSNFFRWVEADAARADQYARAREASADADADDVTDIGKRTLRGEFDPQAARVAIDALKWSAGKRKPKVYGDRAVIQGPGENGEHLHKVSADDAFATFVATLGGHAPGPASGSNGAGDVEGEGAA